MRGWGTKLTHKYLVILFTLYHLHLSCHGGRTDRSQSESLQNAVPVCLDYLRSGANQHYPRKSTVQLTNIRFFLLLSRFKQQLS